MKRTTIQLGAVISAAFLLIAMLIGCSRGTSCDEQTGNESPGGLPGGRPDDNRDSSEYVYVSETISLPKDIGEIGNIAYFDNKMYLTADDDIYSMNLDGTELSKLANYTPHAQPPEGTEGTVRIQRTDIDSEGNLWVIEGRFFYRFDLPPDFDEESGDPWDYVETVDPGYVVRKLDLSGTELLILDISSFIGQQPYLYVTAFTAENTGGGDNIYLGCLEYGKGSVTVYVLDNDGNILLEIDTDSDFEQFIRMPDGFVAYPANPVYENNSIQLQIIDTPAKALGEAVTIPASGMFIYSGGGMADVLVSDSVNLYGFAFGDEEARTLLSWVESGVSVSRIDIIAMTDEEDIICINDDILDASRRELLHLTKIPRSQIPEITVLKLATYRLTDDLANAVANFNVESREYRIEVTDYMESNSDTDLMRLNTEIISGTPPDILSGYGYSWLSYPELANAGVLADLYQFIDADPEYDRDDIVPAVLRSEEINGGLYRLAPNFYIETIIGHPSIVGSGAGWNIDEFEALLDARPKADMPLGGYMTDSEFFLQAVTVGISDYIDFETGEIRFDSPEFIKLLEQSARLPHRADANVSQEDALASGRQIMMFGSVGNITGYMLHESAFDGDIVFKGYPTENRNGHALVAGDNALSIMENSPHKDAAWSFVRTFLDKDSQLATAQRTRGSRFPTNQAAMTQLATDLMEAAADDVDGIIRNYNGVDIRYPVQADIDKLNALIDSVSGDSPRNVDYTLQNIITGGAADCFNGLISAQDAAAVIQSKVTIWYSERN